MEVKKGFKQTDIGVIPNDWEALKIKDFTHVFAGGTPSTFMKEYWNGEIKWMNSGELNLKKVFDVENRITEQGLKFSSTRLIPEKCILIGLAGQGKTRGTVAINMVELCTNQSIAAVYPATKIIPEYLYYNLDSRYNELRNLSTGDGGRGGLNLSIIKNLLIAFPISNVEQENISQALTDIDNLIASIEKIIKKKRSVKQGAIQKLFISKTDWETKALGEIGRPYGGLSGKSKSDFQNGNYPYIPFMNILSNPIIDVGYFGYVKIKNGESQNNAMKGDLFFNGSSETPEDVGMCSVLLQDVPNLYLNSFCFGFRLKKELNINGLYLSYFFRSGAGRSLLYSSAQGATRYNLSKNNFLKIKIRLPKTAEQEEIATTLSDIDKEISQLQGKLGKVKQIKQGMMQQLLTGKIRLV